MCILFHFYIFCKFIIKKKTKTFNLYILKCKKTAILSEKIAVLFWPSEIFGGVKSWGTKLGDNS